MPHIDLSAGTLEYVHTGGDPACEASDNFPPGDRR